MTFLKPCYICGVKLRTGVLMISTFYMILCTLLMAFCLREYCMHFQYGEARSREKHFNIGTDNEDLYMYLGLFSFFHLLFSLLLWHGAIKKSRNRCLIWLFLSSIETTILLIRIIFYDVMHYRFQMVLLFVNLYNLWVVWAFIGEIFEEEARAPLITTSSSPTTIQIQAIIPPTDQVIVEDKGQPDRYVIVPDKTKKKGLRYPSLTIPSSIPVSSAVHEEGDNTKLAAGHGHSVIFIA